MKKSTAKSKKGIVLGALALVLIAVGACVFLWENFNGNTKDSTSNAQEQEYEFSKEKSVKEQMYEYENKIVPELKKQADAYYGVPKDQRTDTAKYNLDLIVQKQSAAYRAIEAAEKTKEEQKIWEDMKERVNQVVIPIKSRWMGDDE